MSRKPTTNALELMDRKLFDGKPETKAMREEAREAYRIALLVRDRRLEAGLSQAELARRVGTTQSAISRLESADYTGHSLSALRRIAAVLGCKVLVDIVPMTDTHKRPTAGSVAATHR